LVNFSTLSRKWGILKEQFSILTTSPVFGDHLTQNIIDFAYSKIDNVTNCNLLDFLKGKRREK
jgi:hypothetical protein